MSSRSRTAPKRPRRTPSPSSNEEPLASQEELRGLPLFASVVAHEIRNPLSSVKIALQTVERHGQIGDKDGTRLRIALREVATIEKVLTDVLDWARPGELVADFVSIDEVITEAVRLVDEAVRARSLTIRIEHSALAPVSVDVDRSRLSKAIAELLQNAADASSPHGIIRITVEQHLPTVQIVVEDDGRGFSPEELERAFDPFFSTKARGVGLGLPRARATARRHGGDVRVEQREEGGARAILSLPSAIVPGKPLIEPARRRATD